MPLITRLVAAPAGPSPYRAAILREQAVLPALCGLPRIVRAFVGVR